MPSNTQVALVVGVCHYTHIRKNSEQFVHGVSHLQPSRPKDGPPL